MTHYCTCGHARDAHLGGDIIANCGVCYCRKFDDATSEYTERLAKLGTGALEAARQRLERTGSLKPFLILVERDGRERTIPLPGEVVESAVAKDHLFSRVRDAVRERGIRSVVFTFDGWYTRSTEKGALMAPEEFVKLVGERGTDHVVKAGFAIRSECVVVSIQTPERSMMLYELYDRDDDARKITFTDHVQIEGSVDSWGGRAQIYGNPDQELPV